MAFELISTTTVSAGGAASIDFTSIPQTYKDLMVVLSGRSTLATVEFRIRFNSDTGANYPYRRLFGDGSSASSGSGTPTYLPFYGSGANGFTSNTFGNSSIYIPNYTGSTYKSISVDAVSENNATESYQTIGAGLWNSTSAITSITLIAGSGNWEQYSTASLYGVSTTGATGATVS